MSVLIKGMAMPKSCNECPFGKEKRLDVGIICTLLDGTTFDTTSRPTSMCPLVEIPPHGRLIDADALTQQIMMKADATCGWADMLDLALAPTIIESEVEDG